MQHLLDFTIILEMDAPPDPSDPPMLGELLFTLPQGIAHDVRSLEDIVNFDQMPVISGRWVDFTRMDRIRIKLDNSNTIKKRSYTFQFPVFVPKKMPASNIWVVSLCGLDGGCWSPYDADVLLNFPIAGFQIGEIHPLAAQDEEAAAGSLVVAVIAALLAF